MQHLTLFVLCSQDPNRYPVPLEIANWPPNQWFETSTHIFQATPPQVGAQEVINGVEWTILEVHSYTTKQVEQFPIASFHIAVCTENGTPHQRNDWLDWDEPHFYEVFIQRGEELTRDGGAIIHLKRTTEVGCLWKPGEILLEASQWYVHSVQSFLPVEGRPIQGYDQVFVCWCERNPNPLPVDSGWEVCPVIPPDSYLMPINPDRSQVLFYVELTIVKNLTVTETFKLLEELGYQPQFRYWEWQAPNGQRGVRLFALLKHEQHDYNLPVDPKYLVDEQKVLWQRIVPSVAVCLKKGCPPRQLVSLFSQST